jgi:hypothetical protein
LKPGRLKILKDKSALSSGGQNHLAFFDIQAGLCRSIE